MDKMNSRYRLELEDQYNFVKNTLFDDEKEALRNYTRSYNEMINRYLRGVIPYLSKKYYDAFKQIDNAFFRIKAINRPITLYRGSEVKELDNRTFQSTSFNIDISKGFTKNKCCLFILTVNPGVKVIPLMDISAHPYEEEFLLQRDAHYIVTDSGIEDGILTIYVTVLPDNTYEITPEISKDVIQIEKQKHHDDIIRSVKETINDEMETFGEQPTNDDIMASLSYSFEAYYQRKPSQSELLDIYKMGWHSDLQED